MRIISTALLLFICVAARARINSLPPAFYTQQGSSAQGAYLRKIIGDSVTKGAFDAVPGWCHLGLSLSRQTPGDTLSAYFYQFLGDAYDSRQPDSAAHYFRLALDSWRAIPLAKEVYLTQSLLYDYMALDNRDSILAYTHALERVIAPLPDTAHRKLSAQNTVASAYAGINQYANALAAFQLVIRHALPLHDTPVLRNAFVNLGSAYNQTGNDSLAFYYTLQALPYLGASPNERIVVYGNLSDYAAANHRLGEARIYLAQAKAAAKESGDAGAMAFAGVREATILFDEKQYAATARVLEGALRYYRAQPPEVNLVNSLVLQASLDTALHNYALARIHLQELDTVTRGMNTRAFAALSLQMQAVVAERMGHYKEAYEYQRAFIILNDSINTRKVAERFAEMQAQYETYRKEEQIGLLQKQARIKDLELKTSQRSTALLIALTLALLALFAALLYIRRHRARNAMRQLRSALEMKALRSQMNPHFIFNSLNSIQKYIWENRREDAAEYLTKFARLIRLVLENSQHATVPLSEELAALQLYIDMEHRRNNQKFDYSISVADDVDAQHILVPPLLLQPYVENAVWHGLSQKEGRGKLSITITREANALRYLVDDDGIGRAQAALIRKDALPRKSLAMNISAERIAWLKRDGGLDASVNTEDKQVDGKSAGTSVRITLPIIPAT